MDKNTLSQYGWVTIVIIIIIILLGFASPFGQFIKNSVWSTLESFRNASGIEDITTPPTNYSEDDITNNEHIYGIGATKPEYVTAVFNDDFTEITITRNGTDSDGLMMNWTNPVTPSKTPMYEHKSTLKKIVVESGVKNIGNYACYQCAELEELQLPEGLTEIGGASFYSTTKLKNVAFPDSLETIGAQSFRQSGLTSVNFGNNLESIGKLAFYKCSSLTGSLSFPDSLKSIGYYCFGDDTGLNGTISFGNSLEVINAYAFSNCNHLTGDLTFPSSLKYIYHFAFQLCTGLNGKLTLNEGLIHIGDGVFNHCRAFNNTEIIIPSTLKTIGGDSRCNVTSTTSSGTVGEITEYKPSSLLNHSTHVFYDCATATLKAFAVANGNTSFIANQNALFTSDVKRLVAVPASREGAVFEIPEGVEIIDEMAFSRPILSTASDKLKTIKLPNSYSIKTTDDYENSLNRGAMNSLSSSIYTFSSITDVIVNDNNPNYKTINGSLYSKDGTVLIYAAPGRSDVLTIPNSVTTIEYGAFSGFIHTYSSARPNANVPKVIIPASVTTMYDTDLASLQEYMDKGGLIEIEEGNTLLKINGSKLEALQTISPK